jgi:hypothetical protein
MDEESVEKFSPMCTSEGVAGLWLAQHIPTSGREMQVSLGVVIDAMIAEGFRKGLLDAIKALEETPTTGAAIASLEADVIKLTRAIRLKRDEGTSHHQQKCA